MTDNPAGGNRPQRLRRADKDDPAIPGKGDRDGNPHDDGHGKPPREEPYGVWLVVRYDTADYGHRPVPPGDVFWLSPDIWVTGGTGLGTIIEGVPFVPHVRVWNLGVFPASPVQVDFAIVDAALGITSPLLIGTAWIPYLGGLSTAAVACPVPYVREPGAAGHPCLLVKASSSPFDPAPTGYNSFLDRHTGQRNLTVVPTGSMATMSLQLETALVLGRGTPQFAATAVVAERAEDLLRPGAAALRHAIEALEKSGGLAPELRRRAELLAARQKTAPLVKAIDARGFVTVRGFDGPAPDPLPLRAARGEPAALGPLPGKPATDSRTKVDVEIVFPDVGSDLAVHLWQLEGGIPTGGYTVLVTKQHKLDLGATGTHEVGGLNDTRESKDATPPGGRAKDTRPAGTETEMAENMKGERESIDDLVIDQFPAVRATRDVSRQLAPMLPIRSADELRKTLESTALVIEGERLDVSGALEVIPEDVFPIENPADLVAKVAAAVRIGSSLAIEGKLEARSERLARIALDVAARPVGGGRGIPAGHFAGPSLFGFEKEN